MGRSHRYRDRCQAGEALAQAVEPVLAGLPAWPSPPLVLALPRGGVPVAAAVASRLGVAVDVLLVRKVGVPGHEELALGAVADGGVVVRNEAVLRAARVDEAGFGRALDKAQRELAERAAALRGDRPAPLVAGRQVLLVDDGLATGATMRAAVAAVRAAGASSVVVAVPVGSPDVCAELEELADAVVCPLQPRGLGAVGAWYDDFSQTTDAEVRRVLAPGDG